MLLLKPTKIGKINNNSQLKLSQSLKNLIPKIIRNQISTLTILIITLFNNRHFKLLMMKFINYHNVLLHRKQSNKFNCLRYNIVINLSQLSVKINLFQRNVKTNFLMSNNRLSSIKTYNFKNKNQV